MSAECLEVFGVLLFYLYPSSMITGRRRSVIFFTVFGICLVSIAVALNVSWVLLNWRMGVLAVLGVIFFLFVIAGMVLNTIFLVREIRRNEQHDSFINAVTHELKTPVASIRLYLQTLQTRELDADKRSEFYRIMLEDSDRLLHTIDQVLRAGSAGPRFRRGARARVDLAELTRECVALARTRFHLEDEVLNYEEDVPAGAAIVLGDPDELRAAVGNLLDNAVKYSPAGVSIRIRLEELDNDRLAVRVTDQGIGISPENLKRIFRRFYRVPATLPVRAKGSGLGLFIVRSVAKKHRGRAFAESPGAGHGSTFTLLLPKAPGA
jgi:two-component system, OmpR family, sensor histidine kinase SenX3